MLLDFQKLSRKFESKETTRKVTVVLYHKEDNKFIIHGENNQLTKYLEDVHATGSVGECYYTGDFALACIGKRDKNEMVSRMNVKKAMAKVQKIIPEKSEVIFEETEFAEDAVYGFIIGGYTYDFLKTEKNKKEFLITAKPEAIKIANAQNFSRFLGDTPANLMTPTLFAKYAKEYLDKFIGKSITEFRVHGRDYIKEKGMNLMLSVSQGSAEEPVLLHIKYMGKDSNTVNSSESVIDIALVGKGVTFDTGGTSIKPSAGMAAMKNDMMGAGTLLATIGLVAELGLKINISATFPLVENMPGSKATKPGDVFVSMSGKTVEVDNTDAEGRLILADAITYAQLDKPKYLFDCATLTGAMVVALGTVYGGFFSNDEDLASIIYSAGIAANDPLWRMPLSPYYQQALKSHVADLNNMGGPGAGSPKAAEFLHSFVETKWAHFDIAGLMDKSFNSELFGNEATGRPIPAFLEIIKKLI